MAICWTPASRHGTWEFFTHEVKTTMEPQGSHIQFLKNMEKAVDYEAIFPAM
jgi:hypothetical protein